MEAVASTEFSRFTNGFREVVFLTGLVSATGTSSVAFVVAARALVVLAAVGSTAAAVFVREEARVAVVGFVVIVEFNDLSLQDFLCKAHVARDRWVHNTELLQPYALFVRTHSSCNQLVCLNRQLKSAR